MRNVRDYKQKNAIGNNSIRPRRLIDAPRASRTGLSAVEPSLKQQNLDIEKARPETGVRKLGDAV